MRSGQLICIFLILLTVAGGCAYTKKEVIIVPCVIPANLSYAKDIAPIIEGYCSDCHSSGSNATGILLDNYDGLVFYAKTGWLYGNISHAPGYNNMPRGGGKLSDCTIATIKKWIDSGTPH